MRRRNKNHLDSPKKYWLVKLKKFNVNIKIKKLAPSFISEVKVRIQVLIKVLIKVFKI